MKPTARIADLLHAVAAKTPFRKVYVDRWADVARAFPSLSPYIRASFERTPERWANLYFEPRRVEVGGVSILLHPHVGEFDGRSLFAKDLNYEKPVFAWLSENLKGYQSVIEIGANVGVYSCFWPKAFSGRVTCFEPSFMAFARLKRNLEANGVEVQAINAAVSDCAGPVRFYEPCGALSNGSLLREFATMFGETRTTTTSAIDARSLENYATGKALLKIDAEGYEARILARLTWSPDMIVEVLEPHADGIEQAIKDRGYERFLLTPDGLEQHPKLFGHPRHRDWLLKAPAAR